MAIGVKVGSAYIDVSAPSDGLKSDMRRAKVLVEQEAKKMQQELKDIKADIDTGLMKMKLSEVRKLHTALKQQLDQKIKMNADINSIEKTRTALGSVENALRGVDEKAKETKKTFGEWARTIGLITISFMALRKAFRFAVESKNLARDAEEIASKFATVFSSLGDRAEKMADKFSESFGVAGSTARELLGSTGDLLVGFGFTEEKALDLSLSVNSLAQDLASFTNFSGGAKGASDALTKAILGETESAKSLGIVIRQNTKEFTAEVKAVQQAKGLTEQQAKALVILEQAYKQSGKAVGDYARTKDSLANTERRLNEQFKEFQEDIGKELASTYKILITLVAEMSTNMGDSTSSINAFGVALKSLATPTIILMTLIKTFSNAMGAFGASIAHLVKGNFAAAQKAITSGMKMQYRDFNTMSTAVTALWEDTSKKIGGMDMNPGSSGSGNNGGGVDESFIKNKMSAYDKMYNDLRYLALGYSDYRKKMIDEEYKRILKLTNDAVNAERWKNKQLGQLDEERKALFDAPLKDSIQSEFDFMEELISKDEERAQKKLEQELELAEVRRQIVEEIHQKELATMNELLGYAYEFGSALQSTGNNFIESLGKALQIALRISDALNRDYGSSLAGILGVGASIIPGLGFLGSILGFSKGGTAIGTPHGLQVNKKGFAGMNNFKVPGGFYKDDYLIGVKSGEKVTVEPTGGNGQSFNDRGIIKAIAQLQKNFNGRLDALSFNVVTAVNSKPPTIIQIDGRTIAKVSESNLNTLTREGVNRNAL